MPRCTEVSARGVRTSRGRGRGRSPGCQIQDVPCTGSGSGPLNPSRRGGCRAPARRYLTTSMTGAALAAALVRRGLDAEERARKESLFDLVVNTFRALDHAGVSMPSTAAEDDVHAWWVPGRLEVFGTHTDYAGGHTLVCAVPRGFAVLARRRGDGLVRIVDAARHQDMSWHSRQPVSEPAQSSAAGWRRYVGVVARRLARNFPGAALGVDIVLASDLPRASGMSSSSALVVSVATALVCAAALRTRA